MTSRSVRRARHLGGPSRHAFGNARRLVPHEQTAADRYKSSERRHLCQRLVLRINLNAAREIACSNLLAAGKFVRWGNTPSAGLLPPATRPTRQAGPATGLGRGVGPVWRAILVSAADQSRAGELGLKTCDQRPFGNADGHSGQSFQKPHPLSR